MLLLFILIELILFGLVTFVLIIFILLILLLLSFIVFWLYILNLLILLEYILFILILLKLFVFTLLLIKLILLFDSVIIVFIDSLKLLPVLFIDSLKFILDLFMLSLELVLVLSSYILISFWKNELLKVSSFLKFGGVFKLCNSWAEILPNWFKVTFILLISFKHIFGNIPLYFISKTKSTILSLAETK